MNQAELETFLRAFPVANSYGNHTYGLDDLDFEDFIKDLAQGIIAEFC